MRLSQTLYPVSFGIQYLGAPSYASKPEPILRVDLGPRRLYLDMPWQHRGTRPTSPKWGFYLSRYVLTAHWGYNTWNFYLPTNPNT